MIARRLIVGGVMAFAPLPPREPFVPVGDAFTVAGGGGYKAFPGLCIMPNGELLVAYRSGATHTSVDGVILGNISSDGGETWGSPFTIYDSATDARDPSLVTLSDDRIACSFFELDGTFGTGVFVTFSDDNGATWDTPIEMVSGYSIEVACSSPIVEVGGTLLQAIYGRSGTDWDASVLFSDDGGATWGDEVTIGTGGGHDWTEPWLLKLLSGDLLALIRVDDINDIYATTSTDDGATWDTPANRYAGDSRASSIVISTGTIFSITRGDGNADGFYRNSLDDGATWDSPGLWTSANFEYAAMAEFESGRVVAVWSQEASSTDADIYLSEIA